jgi:hypothetical protein
MVKIPAISLEMKPASQEAKALVGFRWAGGDIGQRSRLGGDPDWLQDEKTPICSCEKKMTFYGQLDSIGDSICLGDCGLIYVFVCFECLETKSILQCY